ncbi:MAG: hypothetical protein KA885_10150 [Spirochaetes bacterium]|nr:hypothetical protein [Spirochaetota bacterium]
MEKNINKRLDLKRKKELIKFGISFSIRMIILSLVARLNKFHISIQIIPMILACLHITATIIYYKALIPTHFILSKIGSFLGMVFTATIMTIFFYLFFTPFSIVARLFKKDHIKKELLSPGWREVPDIKNDPERIKKLF